MFKAAVLGCLLCCASLVSAQEVITVAVASSYAEQAKVYAAQFEATNDVNVRVVSGSTGRLYNQIKQGAPFDVFIAAGTDFIPSLNAENKVVGQGYLGLKVKGQWLTNLQILQDKNIKTIALANPKVAPFGRAAKVLLKQAKLWQIIQAKLVYAQNAMQASMMVNQGLVDVAFVPVANGERYIATVPYVAVCLTDKWLVHRFFAIFSSQ